MPDCFSHVPQDACFTIEGEPLRSCSAITCSRTPRETRNIMQRNSIALHTHQGRGQCRRWQRGTHLSSHYYSTLGRMLHLCLGTTSPRLPVFRAAQIGTNVDSPRSSLVSRARLALVTVHLTFPPASLSSSRLALVTAHLAYVSLSLCLYESRSRLRISLSSTHLARSHLARSTPLCVTWRHLARLLSGGGSGTPLLYF